MLRLSSEPGGYQSNGSAGSTRDFGQLRFQLTCKSVYRRRHRKTPDSTNLAPGCLNSRINRVLTFSCSFAVNIFPMPEQPLQIEELAGSREGIHIMRLSGPLTLQNLFGFQSKLRADHSRALILDFTNVPLADSAGIGALVGAYVTRQKDGRSLGLVAVNQRILNALEVTRVQTFFRFYGTVAEAEAAA